MIRKCFILKLIKKYVIYNFKFINNKKAKKIIKYYYLFR